MHISRRELWQSAKVLLLALFLSVGVPYALAWTGPTAAAPGNNTPAPVNVGAATQTKAGRLTVSTDFFSNTISTNYFLMPTGKGAGKVLTSDASGNASWQSVSSCVTANSGITRYNISNSKLEYCNGSSWASVPISGGTATGGKSVYTTGGTYSFTVPSGVTRITVKMVGGGGVGGTLTAWGSAGGGGGGYATKVMTVSPGAVYSLTVAAPRTDTAGIFAGGGATSFGVGTTPSVSCSAGGDSSGYFSNNNYAGVGGVAGTCTGGDANVAGSPGKSGVWYGSSSDSWVSGNGGNAASGSGSCTGGVGGTGGTTYTRPTNGSNYGAGAGGSGANFFAKGAGGCISIEW